MLEISPFVFDNFSVEGTKGKIKHSILLKAFICFTLYSLSKER